MPTPARGRSFDTIRPKRIRRGPVFTCEGFCERCNNALCDLCTARLVARLVQHVARETRAGNWWTFTIIWTVHRYTDLKLLAVNVRNIKRAIRQKLVDAGLNGFPIIAATDLNLEDIAVGTGARFWQIHLHGFIEVGVHERVVKKKLRNAFRAGAPLDLGYGIRLPIVKVPVVFKRITDLVNWMGYSLKEPSRIVDKRVTAFMTQKTEKKSPEQSHAGDGSLRTFLQKHRAGVWPSNRPPPAEVPVLRRLRHKMNSDEFDVLHGFLRQMRVRDRLFLQQYDVRPNGELVRLPPPFGPRRSVMKVKPKRGQKPIIGSYTNSPATPMKTVRTRGLTVK